MGTQNASAYTVFSIEELEEATNGFHQAVLLGEGSIGKVPHNIAMDSRCPCRH